MLQIAIQGADNKEVAVIEGALPGVEVLDDLGCDIQQVKQRIEAMIIHVFLKDYGGFEFTFVDLQGSIQIHLGAQVRAFDGCHAPEVDGPESN